ncbi:hypothetical protein Tco_1033296 [Tanacetum coccineum]|uniref:Uncharacterized protein n=1 Tax=Tanacetum coccineum TaxID=301880 RepID=A0ABQ5GFM5_9ASTR
MHPLWIRRNAFEKQTWLALIEIQMSSKRCFLNKINFNHVAPTPTSFVSAVKGVSSPPIPLASSPALVLDDSCMVARDLDNFVMGEPYRYQVASVNVVLDLNVFTESTILFSEYILLLLLCTSESSWTKKFVKSVLGDVECGATTTSPGPDGFTFEFFRKFWTVFLRSGWRCLPFPRITLFMVFISISFCHSRGSSITDLSTAYPSNMDFYLITEFDITSAWFQALVFSPLHRFGLVSSWVSPCKATSVLEGIFGTVG